MILASNVITFFFGFSEKDERTEKDRAQSSCVKQRAVRNESERASERDRESYQIDQFIKF